MKIRISHPLCFSEKGKKPNQEDSLYPQKGKATAECRVLMVCDGMGGHEHGEVASACVADTIGRMTSEMPLCTSAEMKEAFGQALRQTYDNLDALDTDDSHVKKMGTTLTFLALCTDGILVAHIGDSRVYQMRRGCGIVFQTRDHSLVNDLIAAGEITEEEARHYPQRNVITRAVQPHQEYPAKASFSLLTDVRKGDLLMLCCDGVVEQLDNADLVRLLLTDESLADRLEVLRKECTERGTRDNHTCYIFEVETVEGSEIADVSAVGSADTSTSNHDAPPVSTSTPSTRNNRYLWILTVALAVLCFVGGLFVFSSHHQKASDDGVKKVQTQGTITRHHN